MFFGLNCKKFVFGFIKHVSGSGYSVASRFFSYFCACLFFRFAVRSCQFSFTFSPFRFLFRIACAICCACFIRIWNNLSWSGLIILACAVKTNCLPVTHTLDQILGFFYIDLGLGSTMLDLSCIFPLSSRSTVSLYYACLGTFLLPLTVPYHKCSLLFTLGKNWLFYIKAFHFRTYCTRKILHVFCSLPLVVSKNNLQYILALFKPQYGTVLA